MKAIFMNYEPSVTLTAYKGETSFSRTRLQAQYSDEMVEEGIMASR